MGSVGAEEDADEEEHPALTSAHESRRKNAPME
jgi:hypothetical protein